MAKPTNFMKLLLEDENIRKKVSYFIEEEVIVPDSSDSESDIEILEENVNENSISSNINFEVGGPVEVQLKKNNSVQIHEKSKADTRTNGPVYQENIRSLLQNEEIRKQIAPFIQEEVLIMEDFDCSDNETSEENNSTDSQIIEDEIIEIEQIEEHISENNLNGNKEKSNSKIVQIYDLVGSDDETTSGCKTKIVNNNGFLKESQKINKKIIERIENSLNIVNPNNFNTDKNVFTTNTIEKNSNNSSINSKSDNDDLAIVDSDDWYYLNIRNSLEEPNIVENNCDNIKVSKQSENKKGQPLETNNVKKRKRKKRKGKCWSTVRKKTTKIKLQGKIIRRGLKNAETNIKLVSEKSVNQESHSVIKDNMNIPHSKNTTAEARSVIENNSSYQTKQASIIKEETMLPDHLEIEETDESKVNAPNVEKKFINSDCTQNFLNSELQFYIKKERIQNCYDQNLPNQIENGIRMEYKANCSKDMDNSAKKFLAKKRISKSNIAVQKIHPGKRKIRNRCKSLKKCFKCGRMYERYGNLMRHEKLCKFNQNMLYECAMCSFKTKRRNQFRDHIGNHILGRDKTNHDRNIMKNELNSTKDRKKLFYLQYYLKALCKICKTNTDAVQRITNCRKCCTMLDYWCSMCGKDYPTYTKLRNHVLYSLRNASLKTCCECGRGHFSLCLLNKHEDLCGTKCSAVYDKLPYVRLVRHEIRANEGPVNLLQAYCSKCETATIAFRHKTTCEKCESLLLYKCELCSELLVTLSNLRDHVLSTHIIDSYKCTTVTHLPEKVCSLEKSIDSNVISNNNDNYHIDNGNLNKDFSENVSLNNSEAEENSSLQIEVNALKSIENNAQSKEIHCEVKKNDTSNTKCLRKNNRTTRRLAINEKGSRIFKLVKFKYYCLQCDQFKRDVEKIKIGQKKELCRKCKRELLFWCILCNRKLKTYSTTINHLKYKCAFILYLRNQKIKNGKNICDTKININDLKKQKKSCKIYNKYRYIRFSYKSNHKSYWIDHMNTHASVDATKKKSV